MLRLQPIRPQTGLIALALAALGCGGTALAPTLPPPASTVTPTSPTVIAPPTEPGGIAAGSLEVRSTASYIDSFNYFHLVGEVFNGTDTPLTGIELTAYVADAAGQPTLDGDDQPIDGSTFSPLLYSLGPGESAPFDFFRLLPEGADTTGWQAAVSVAAQQTIALNRAAVEVVNTHVAVNPGGAVYLTGELVNPGSTPVKINSLAGALLADGVQVIAANATANFSSYLAASGDPTGGDRTPFVIGIDAPLDAGTDARYYVDAETTEAQTVAGGVVIEVNNRFSDEYDDLHLSATVTNNTAELLTIRLVAGLYAADGTVLDASSVSTPIYAAPGASVPVTFEYFDSLNRRAEDQALVDRVSVQVDPLWTYPIPISVADLQTANEVKEPVGTAQYSFRGDVVNSTEAELTSATVILAIFDGSDNLVSSNWMNLYPETETLKPGEALPFDLIVFVPTDADVSAYTFTTFVQGYVKE